MIERIEPRGKLVDDCATDGETRADGVAPAHPNGIPLSRTRFLLLVSTLGFRGVDDSRSILYQIRDGGYDGQIIREGMLARSVDNWQPLGDGTRCVRQYGHPVAFGVPKGARIAGRPATHANVFVVKWRVCARVLHPDGYLLWGNQPPDVLRRTQGVEWVQFRLNDAEDDIEILQSARSLRQKGYEAGPAFCSADVCFMNQTYVQAVPFNSDATEWVDANHFDFEDMHHRQGGLIAPLRYRFNAERGLYEWVEIGPRIDAGLFEGSIVPFRGDWLIAGRPQKGGPIGWARVNDLFHEQPAVVFPAEPYNKAPLSVYACPDGAVRLFSGDPTVSPYGRNRNPLYSWEIDPDRGFVPSRRQVVFDTLAAGIPIPAEIGPIADMPKLLSHPGGREQLLVHRVRSSALRKNDPAYGGMFQLTEEAFQATAIYGARIRYAEELPGAWDFENGRAQ